MTRLLLTAIAALTFIPTLQAAPLFRGQALAIGRSPARPISRLERRQRPRLEPGLGPP